MKKNIVNWGIISTAKIGWEHVIPAIQKSKNSKVLGLASRDLKKAKSLCKKFDYELLILRKSPLRKDDAKDVVGGVYLLQF